MPSLCLVRIPDVLGSEGDPVGVGLKCLGCHVSGDFSMCLGPTAYVFFVNV